MSRFRNSINQGIIIKRNRKNVSRTLKERITMASLEPECDLVSLEKKVSLVELYSRKMEKKLSDTAVRKYINKIRSATCRITVTT